MQMHIVNLIPLTLFAVFCGWMAFAIGRSMGRDSRNPQLEMLWRYQIAVDDLDRWCGHTSPHARLIARHLKTIGEGTEGLNAGTPVGVEPCTIDGLREQLKKLDAYESNLSEMSGGQRLLAALEAHKRGRVMQGEAARFIESFLSDPNNYPEHDKPKTLAA